MATTKAPLTSDRGREVSKGAGVDIERITTPTDDVRLLIGELDQVLAAEYLPEQRHGLALEALFEPHIRFFLARLNGAAVGCGGMALFGDFAEVKRMYVREPARGRGVAQALLTRIETEARVAGFGVLRLETGERQAAALRFYSRADFRPCAAFGDYAAMRPEAIATSIFMEKRLATQIP
jgi:putative acetyltransferase